MSDNPNKLTLTRAQAFLGVDRRTIQTWIKKGAPKNEDGSVSIPDLFYWRMDQIQREENKEEDPSKDVDLEIKREKLALIKEVNMPRAEAEAELAAMCSVLREALLVLPGIIAPRLVKQKLHEVREVLEEEIRDCLERVSVAPWDELLSHTLRNLRERLSSSEWKQLLQASCPGTVEARSSVVGKRKRRAKSSATAKGAGSRGGPRSARRVKSATRNGSKKTST